MSTWLAFLMLSGALIAETDGAPVEQTACVEFIRFNGSQSRTRNEESTEKPRGDARPQPVSNPFGVDVRGDDVWITTVGDHRIWRTSLAAADRNDASSAQVRVVTSVPSTGTAAADDVPAAEVTWIAGNGRKGYSGDGGPATKAEFNWPHEVRADQEGNLFIADTRNHVIRRIDHETGIVSTLAGNGSAGFTGDGRSGDQVQFDNPHSIALDGDGGLLVADTKNHRLRHIDLNTGVVSTIAGTGARKLPTDGTSIESAPLFGPRSLAVDADSIWLALREGNSIWRIDRATKTIHHVAGLGQKGYSGDGAAMSEATFRGPKGVALSDAGDLMVVDTENHAIRRLDMAAGTIHTIVGGDMQEKTMSLLRPHGIAFHPRAGWLIADSENDRVLLVSTTEVPSADDGKDNQLPADPSPSGDHQDNPTSRAVKR